MLNQPWRMGMGQGADLQLGQSEEQTLRMGPGQIARLISCYCGWHTKLNFSTLLGEELTSRVAAME
jgi:hypothetical protein